MLASDKCVTMLGATGSAACARRDDRAFQRVPCEAGLASSTTPVSPSITINKVSPSLVACTSYFRPPRSLVRTSVKPCACSDRWMVASLMPTPCCRDGGAVAQAHGVKLALEFNSQHAVINRLAVGRELVAMTDHPNCGLLLDAYHMERCGDGGRAFAVVHPSEIFAFQYSDVPIGTPAAERRPTDRLPPGQGCVRWLEVFRLLAEKRYAGYLSYEAPNPAQWGRPAVEVAREAAQATRSLLREAASAA